jgi:hypothetical protein
MISLVHSNQLIVVAPPFLSIKHDFQTTVTNFTRQQQAE